MPDKIADELGVRKPMAVTGPDPRDEFSQEATENRRARPIADLSDEVGNKGKKKRLRDQPGPPPERDAPPPRDTREAPAPNPGGAAGTTHAPLKRGAVPRGASRPLPENEPEGASAGDHSKRPVRGAAGDALKPRDD